MQLVDNKPVSTIDQNLRERIRQCLMQKNRTKLISTTVLKYLCLAFVVVAIAVPIFKVMTNQGRQHSISEQIHDDKRPCYALSLFYNSARCDFCLKVERYANEFVNSIDTIHGRKIHFVMVNMDDSQNREILKTYKVSFYCLKLFDISDTITDRGIIELGFRDLESQENFNSAVNRFLMEQLPNNPKNK